MKIRLNILICVLSLAGIISCFNTSGNSGKEGGESESSIAKEVRVYPSNISGSGEEAWVMLFDNDIDTACSFEGSRSITLSFEDKAELSGISIYGLSGKSIRIYGKEDSPVPIAESNTGSADGWINLTAEKTERTDTLRIVLTGEGTGSISEIAVWERAEAACDFTVNEGNLEGILEEGKAEYPAKVISMTPAEFDLATGANVSLKFDIFTEPGNIKKAYFVFEGRNVFRSVSIGKSVNGNAVLGGFNITHSADTSEWKGFYEEINPSWLESGKNLVELSFNGSAKIRKARVVIVFDSGWNSVSEMSEKELYDGDTLSSVKIPGGTSFDVVFDRKVLVSDMLVHSPGISAGTISVKGITDGSAESLSFKATACEENEEGGSVSGGYQSSVSLSGGWNSLNFKNAGADTLRVSASSGEEGITLSDILVRTLPLKKSLDPKIVVSFPVDGEFFGRTAYLEGFTVPEGNNISIEGKSDGRGASDGSFSMALTKDETRYSADTDEAAWDPVVSAVISGETVTKEINLYGDYYSRDNDASTEDGSGDTGDAVTVDANGKYTTTIYPDRESTISVDNMTVIFPKGSVTKETVISITPLSESELEALDPGMVNVTYPAAGYRFLPHGIFSKYIEIHFNYTKSRLLKSQSDNDVYMYYYDTTAKRWSRLERVKVESSKSLVYSRTNHFTDIINATVTVPEHPDPLSLNPNTIKDLKAGDPSSGITMMEAPGFSNMGEASLSYPIEIPKGRKGMEPQVALRYTSTLENSWCGTGWNLAPQSVSIDTKFGVPRYDGSERYSLNGAELVADPDTSGQYRMRVEGQFARILRKTNGGIYYWEVTEKSGVKYIYGRTAQARLFDSENTAHVFQWFLEQIIDTNGNSVDYTYFADTYTGNGETGKQLYLSKISYTGLNGSGGAYNVVFNRGSAERNDAFSNCRAGFKVYTRYYLESIDIYYGTSLARRYGLSYTTNSFGKMMLSKAAQYGSTGIELASHSFEYYDEIGSGSIVEGFEEPDDSLWENIMSWVVNLIVSSPSTSGIGSNKGSEKTANFTVSFSPLNFLKMLSLGAQFGINKNSSKTTVQLIDIDGDNLPDQVYLYGFSARYRKNLGGASGEGNRFSEDSISIPGLSSLGADEGDGYTIGGIINFVAQLSRDRNKSTAYTEKYFSDINGDGLVDFVNGSKILYNNLDTTSGTPYFSSTPPSYTSAIAYSGEGEAETNDIELSYPEVEGAISAGSENPEEIFYLDDPIRMWRAPYPGFISITGNVSILEGTRPASDPDEEYEEYTLDDGITATIQLNDSVLWTAEIGRDDFEKKAHDLGSILVEEGDQVFFRVNSVNDGAYDIVEWDPLISYDGKPDDETTHDENNLSIFKYQASEDFSIAGKKDMWVAIADGTADFLCSINKTKAVTDDILVEIVPVRLVANTDGSYKYEYGFPAGTLKIPAEGTGEFTLSLEGHSVNIQDIDDENDTDYGMYLFRYRSDSPVDLSAFTCRNSVEYKKYMVTDDAGNTYEEDAPLDQDGNPVMKYYVTSYFPVFSSLYSGSSIPWTATETGTIHVDFEAFLTGDEVAAGGVRVALMAKKDGAIVITDDSAEAKEVRVMKPSSDIQDYYDNTIPVENESFTLSFDLYVTEGERLFFIAGIDAGETEVRDNFFISKPEIYYTSGTSAPVRGYENVYMQPPYDDEAFNGGYRQWYYGRFNGNNGAFSTSYIKLPTDIDTSGIDKNTNPDEAEAKANEIAELIKDFSGMSSDSNPGISEESAILKPSSAFPSEEERARGMWFGNDTDTWISPGKICSTRAGRKNIDDIISTSDSGTIIEISSGGVTGGTKTLSKKTISATRSTGLSVSVASGVEAKGVSDCVTDLFDLNGDGYPDIVKNSSSGGSVQYTKSTGATGTSEKPDFGGVIRRNKSTTLNFNAGFPAKSQPTVKVVTLTGDNQVVGQSNASPSFDMSVGGSVGFGESLTDKDFMDVNGDGLPDRVYKDGSDVKVRLNLGYSFGAAETLDEKNEFRIERTATLGISGSAGGGYDDFSYGGGLSKTKSQSAAQSNYIDVNGDGLPDKVVKEVSSSVGSMAEGQGIEAEEDNMRVYYNLGSKFSNNSVEWEGTLDYPVQYSETIKDNVSASGSYKTVVFAAFFFTGTITLNGAAAYNKNAGKTRVSLTDINGDGLADHVCHNETHSAVDVRLNKTGKSGLLKIITRPLGGTITLEYAREGNTQDMPQSRWVLSKVTQTDGMSGTDSSHEYSTSYAYTEGFYHRGERDFLGFGKVVETRDDGSATEHAYNNASYYNKGIELTRAVKGSDGKTYSGIYNTYNNEAVIEGYSYFPQLLQKETRVYEGGSDYKAHIEKYTYDEYGNISTYTDNGDEGTEDDNVTANITYDLRESSYIMSNPYLIRVCDSGGTQYRYCQATYDAKGNMVRLSQHIEGGTNALYQFLYDTYGNLTEITYPENAGGQTYWESYTYDSSAHSYITAVKDAFGYTSYASYDLRYGVPLVTTDINRNSVYYAYDSFGRTIRIYGPYDVGSTPTVRYSYYTDTLPAYCHTQNKEYKDSLSTVDTAIYIDGLKRVIQTKKNSEVNGIKGMTKSGRVIYDSMGRVIQEGQPVFASGISYAYSESTLKNPTIHTYDPIGRKTKSEFPDGSDMEYAYGLSDGLFTTTVTDQEDKTKTQYLTNRGSIVQITEEGGINTYYKYNILNEITRITDNNGNVTTIEYDMLGRRTAITNPDTGRIGYVYDAAGNLKRKITPVLRASGQNISYVYNLTHLVRINYPNDSDVYYYYGAPGAGYNRAGRVYKTENGTVSEVKKFGRMGETVEEARSVTFNSTSTSYTTKYEYDNLGRMRRLTYPDGEMLTYEYDSGGLLASATGVTTSGKTAYIKSMLYDEYGSRTSITYGNGTVSTYTYDEDMHRLTGLKTISSASSVLQNISYEYDDAGNILSRTNSGYVTTDTTEKNATQTYGYDDLHRLVSSTGKINTGSLLGTETNNYTNTFAYDSIGNITQKVQTNNALDSSNNLVKVEDKTYDWSYTYGGQRPHAVTSAGAKTFSYDPNGNMTKSVDSSTSTTRSLTWDDENRLTKVVDSGTNNSLTSFAYDAAGVRVIKSGNSGDVIYVNGTYSVRNSEIYSKHVFAGSTRVASHIVTVETEDDSTTTTDNGAYFYHGDHLGSSSVVTDKAGGFYEDIEYFPYGEDWVDEKASATSDSVAYKFTGKEYDSETGYYNLGARPLDPIRPGWFSVDKAFIDGKYFPNTNDFDTEHDYYWYLSQDANKKLPGIGGVFNSANLNPYCYAGNNPVKYVDPDGNITIAVEYNPYSPTGAVALQLFEGNSAVKFYGSWVTRGVNTSGQEVAIKGGTYGYTVNAASKPAINNGNLVPTEGPNRNHGNRREADAILIHTMNNKAVIDPAHGNKEYIGSEGCQGPTGRKNFGKFMKGKNVGDTGAYDLSRPLQPIKSFTDSIQNIINWFKKK